MINIDFKKIATEPVKPNTRFYGYQNKQIIKSLLSETQDQLLRNMSEACRNSNHAHPNILPCLGFNSQITNEVTELYILYPRLRYVLQDIFIRHIKNNTSFFEREIVRHFDGILSALEYLDEQKLTHGNIKPQNILLNDNYTIKLTEINSGHIAKLKSKVSIYVAPEVYKKDKLTDLEWKYADIWSAGMVMLEMTDLHFSSLLLQKPDTKIEYSEEFHYRISQRIDNLKSKYTEGQALAEVLTHMLNTDPKARTAFRSSWDLVIEKYSGGADGLQLDKIPAGMREDAANDIYQTYEDNDIDKALKKKFAENKASGLQPLEAKLERKKSLKKKRTLDGASKLLKKKKTTDEASSLINTDVQSGQSGQVVHVQSGQSGQTAHVEQGGKTLQAGQPGQVVTTKQGVVGNKDQTHKQEQDEEDDDEEEEEEDDEENEDDEEEENEEKEQEEDQDDKGKKQEEEEKREEKKQVNKTYQKHQEDVEDGYVTNYERKFYQAFYAKFLDRFRLVYQDATLFISVNQPRIEMAPPNFKELIPYILNVTVKSIIATDDDLTLLAAGLLIFNSVYTLIIDIRGSKVTDRGLQYLFDVCLSQFRSIRSFYLWTDSIEVTDVAIASFTKGPITRWRKLRRLFLSLPKTGITNNIFEMLKGPVSKLEMLMDVQLWVFNTRLTDAGAGPFCTEALAGKKDLQTLALALTNTLVSNPTIQDLSTLVLPRLLNLKTLYIHIGNIQASLETLLMFFKSGLGPLKGLLSLNLSFVGIKAFNDEVVKKLIEDGLENKTRIQLFKCYMSNTKVTNQAVLDLCNNFLGGLKFLQLCEISLKGSGANTKILKEVESLPCSKKLKILF